MKTSLHLLGARVARDRIANGTLRAEDYTRACLDRIAERDTLIGAFAFLNPDSALEQARRVDAAQGRGVLGGLPVGVKDIFDTIDMPTEYGSEIYRGFRPWRDATAVARLRRASGIIPGKTVSTEFAGLHPAGTRNPRNPEFTPGGSSSGSAAAVADGMIPLAIGTQTGGSIIRPAAFCGIVGFKPSFGLIDRTGVRPAVESFDTVGVFARSVADAALLVSVLANNINLDILDPIHVPPRIGLCRSLQWDEASEDTKAALETAAQHLSAEGATVTEFDLPVEFRDMSQAQATIFNSGTFNSTLSEYYHHPKLLSPEIREIIREGEVVSETDRRRAEYHIRITAHALDVAMQRDGLDILITPAAPGEAPHGLTTTGSAAFNKIWTALGVPALTIPHLTGAQGMPIGLQIIGRLRADANMLMAAKWIESAIAAKL